MVRGACLVTGILALAAVWFGPLPQLARQSFSAHMTIHMTVVALASPLLALGLNRTKFDPASFAPGLFAPVPASILELLVVWMWHAPALHHLARHTFGGLILEQSMFLFCGLLLWLSAIGGNGSRRAAGIVALLLTSMHMTLLGALLALAPRPLYHQSTIAVVALEDQHLGGAIMLITGGVSYLAGGLALAVSLLRGPTFGHKETQKC